MKKLRIFIIIITIPALMIFSVTSLISLSTPICMAAEKITPYEPEVKYTKPVFGEPSEVPQIKAPSKKKKWGWIVGGLVIAGAVAALSDGGGGGAGGGDNPPPPGEDADVNITW